MRSVCDLFKTISFRYALSQRKTNNTRSVRSSSSSLLFKFYQIHAELATICAPAFRQIREWAETAATRQRCDGVVFQEKRENVKVEEKNSLIASHRRRDYYCQYLHTAHIFIRKVFRLQHHAASSSLSLIVPAHLIRSTECVSIWNRIHRTNCATKFLGMLS